MLKVENAAPGATDGRMAACLDPDPLRDAELSPRASWKITDLQLNADQTFRFNKKTMAEGCIDELRFCTTLSIRFMSNPLLIE
jgi:hypothetical protein